jgi:hypothetical protein
MLTNLCSSQNKDFKGLHRHACFFGEMQYVLQDCCQLCPEPQDDEEKQIADKFKAHYISGPIS